MSEKRNEDRAHDLAMRIYVELVARNSEITQDTVKLAASASNLATLSLRLSDAFLQAEEEAILSKAPKKAEGVHADDVAKWMK